MVGKTIEMARKGIGAVTKAGDTMRGSIDAARLLWKGVAVRCLGQFVPGDEREMRTSKLCWEGLDAFIDESAQKPSDCRK